ncbi:MAG TPA: FAD-binding oxidoreductase [Saprospiraceae bacterium]|nr:FAD-binding oxidoreductase [Saprospiraceae bacterium]
MTQLSYWESSTYFNRPDVVIIGAGLIGLCTGISLLEKDPDLNVLILERHYLPLGASTKNAGFACFGSPSELLDDLRQHDEAAVFSLFKRRWMGVKKLMKYVADAPIDWQQSGGYEVIHSDWSDIQVSQSELNQLNQNIADYTGLQNYFYFDDARLISFGLERFQRLVANQHEALLHPVKLWQALLQLFTESGGRVLFGAAIKEWQELDSSVRILLRDDTAFHARKLIFCVNGFARRYFPELQVQAARTLVLYLHSKREVKLQGCFHLDRGFYYFRNAPGGLIVGGGRQHDLDRENTDEFGVNDRIRRHLLQVVETHILGHREFSVEQEWTGILGMGPEKKPIIQMCGPHTAVAVRMGGMGIAIGSLVGEEAAELLYQQLRSSRS